MSTHNGYINLFSHLSELPHRYVEVFFTPYLSYEESNEFSKLIRMEIKSIFHLGYRLINHVRKRYSQISTENKILLQETMGSIVMLIIVNKSLHIVVQYF